jgi:carbamoyl-phosphate synthase large subunit
MVLSPEMRSTGEVMGIDEDLGFAFVKAFEAAGMRLPKRGQVFISVKNVDKRGIVAEARELARLGYQLLATEGTYRVLKAGSVPVERVNKVHEGRPHIVDKIKNREIDLVLNTPLGKREREDDDRIRAAAVSAGIPCITTAAGISAIVQALSAMHRGEYEVKKLQEYHELPVRTGTPVRA